MIILYYCLSFIGVALNDSPAGLAAYILEKFSTWTQFNHKHLPDGGFSKYNIDELLDNIMVYWVSGSITTSMRLYAEYATKKYQALPHIKYINKILNLRSFQITQYSFCFYFFRAKVNVPAACAMFPHEIPITLALKKFMNQKYANLISANEMKDGGHFAAFEQPKLLAEDIWSSILKMEKIKN